LALSRRPDAPPLSYTRIVLQILLTILAVATALWALHQLERVVIMLVLATFFAYVIAPLVRIAERPLPIAGRPRRLSRGPAILVIYLLVAGGLSIGAATLLPVAAAQIDDAVASTPSYTESFRAWERGRSRLYNRLRIPADVRQRLDRSIADAGEAALGYSRQLLMAIVAVVSYLPWLVLIPVLAFFLLKDAEIFRAALLEALPHHARARADELVDDLNATLAAYIRAQLIACVLVGTICGVGFALMGVPYAVLLGTLAGILEFVPLIGPLILAVTAAVIAALHAPMLALWTLLFLGVLRMIEDYVIYPRLIGHGIHLHPLAIIIAVLAGVELGGIAGIFVAVPVVAVGVVVIRHWLAWRVADDVAPPEAQPM
jgi:predicted PurR-regulated permease PerM